MQNLYLIKLGGSLITDKSKPFTERPETIKRLCQEIHEARQVQKNLKLVVGHGGGSYPHVPAKRFCTAEGIVNAQSLKGIAEVQDAAANLNRIIVRALINAGENAVSVQPSVCSFAKKEISSIIINGNKQGLLKKALLNQDIVGTKICTK